VRLGDIAIAATVIQYQTFAELLTISATVDYEQFSVDERGNAAYTLQPAGYVALVGDATLANGRVAQLQKSPSGWHIENFGAKENTNSTAAIKNSVLRAGGSAIVGNPVSYYIDEEILFSRNKSGIGGIGGVMKLFNLSLTEASIRFSPATPELGNKISNCTIKNLSLGRAAGSSGAVCLKLHSVSQLNVSGLAVLGSHTAIEIKGISSSNLSNLQINAGADIPYLAGSSLITYDGYPLTAGGFNPAFTTNISNIVASCGFNVDHIFNIAECDALEISNGYLASPKASHFNLEPLDASRGITALLCSALYLDGVLNSGGSDSCITVPVHIGTFVNGVKFSACKMGNTNGDIVSILGKVDNFHLIGSSIRNSTAGNAVGISSNPSTSVSIVGGDIGLCNVGVAADNIQSIIVSSVLFLGAGRGVRLSNTESAVLDSLVFKNVTTEFEIISVGTLSGSSCVSDANGIVDVNTGTFTPNLQVNNSTTGITYTTQAGDYVRNGNVVTYAAELTLTSKGVQTGNVTIQNLPFNAKNITPMTIYADNLTAGATGSSLQARSSAAGSASVKLSAINGSGNDASLTDADITNTTSLSISGSYIAD
jgi:hypothetical protein